MHKANPDLDFVVANAFLAIKITFINKIVPLCEHTGADIKQVSKRMGLDGRIGRSSLW